MGPVETNLGFHAKLVLILTCCTVNELFATAIKSQLSSEEAESDRSLWSSSNSKWLQIAKKASIVADVCAKFPDSYHCDRNEKYQSIDGSCNNIDNPSWGSAKIMLTRLTKAVCFNYADIPIRTYHLDNNSRRNMHSSVPEDLPTTRLISTTFPQAPGMKKLKHINEMFTQWGQFIDHDFALTPMDVGPKCCNFTPDSQPPECLQITVPDDDDFFESLGVKCLNFHRSTEYCPENPDSVRDQKNDLTSFLDASTVYGSSSNVTSTLRTFKKGKMIVTKYNLLEKLNKVDDRLLAGENRAHVVAGLSASHTLFVREHNRLCCELHEMYPNWNDERLFQEARRIVIATMQSITYGEYLPVLFGKDLFHHFSKRSSKYDPKVDPSLTNEFSTVSYRFGHSMVSDEIERWSLSGRGTYPIEASPLRNNFKNTSLYELNKGQGMEEVIVGLYSQKSNQLDSFLSKELTNFLFREKGVFHGNDLHAVNSQRGRDHGLPSFCTYYKLFVDDTFDCNSGWDVKYSGFCDEVWETLKTLYRRPQDIDPFIGVISQDLWAKATIGPVGAGMNFVQFWRLKYGDRYFFTHKSYKENNPWEFSIEAIKHLKQRTLGQVICDNTKIKRVLKNVFVAYDHHGNTYVDCKHSPKLDLHALLG